MTKSFLIVRLSSLGDIIHTLPAFYLLRRNFPDAKISWIIEGKGKQILEFTEGLDEIVEINNIYKTIKKIRKNYEYAIDFQGLLKSGLISYFSKAKFRIGFHKKNLKEPIASLFYNHKLTEIKENLHVIKKNIKLLSLLNINGEKIKFPIEIPENYINRAEKKLKKLGHSNNKKLILLNVGAGWETKRWDIENFIRLAEMLKRDDRFILFLWGNSTEERLALKACKETGIPMLPFLSIPELMGLISKASLLISGDSFPLHFASAISVPVVGIFGPTDPVRNGPIRSHDRIAFHRISCSFCYKRKCETTECMKKITVEEVFELALQILNEN